jgi:hypothetical protein
MDITLCYPKFLWEGNELQVGKSGFLEGHVSLREHAYILGNLVHFPINLTIFFTDPCYQWYMYLYLVSLE